jgi:hypothetical protein
MVQHLLLAGIDVASIPGVTEPDPPLAVNCQVVRGVEGQTIELVHDSGRASIRLEAHDGSSSGAAAVQTTFQVEGQTIRMIGIFAKHGARPGRRVIT